MCESSRVTYIGEELYLRSTDCLMCYLLCMTVRVFVHAVLDVAIPARDIITWRTGYECPAVYKWYIFLCQLDERHGLLILTG